MALRQRQTTVAEIVQDGPISRHHRREQQNLDKNLERAYSKSK